MVVLNLLLLYVLFLVEFCLSMLCVAFLRGLEKLRQELNFTSSIPKKQDLGKRGYKGW